MQLERAQAAATDHDERSAEAEARLGDCQTAAAEVRQAVVDSDAAVEAAVDELSDAEEVDLRCSAHIIFMHLEVTTRICDNAEKVAPHEA